ncbi:MAG: hypothetical protein IIW01_08205 [Thermoguttaceae bacterium]|nr:hypothetical protein [Thermoguttaceae bacterium]
MTIKIIYGKPGSGKSYHAVKVMAEILCDWARVERKKGERYPQRLYTNLPINRDAMKAYVEKEIGFEFDVDYYLVSLDDTFFRRPEYQLDNRGCKIMVDGKPVVSYWWNDLPDDLLIVIDEIHRFLGKEYAYVRPLEESAALRDYMGMHRHHRHDWILLTQDKGQIARDVLRMSEQAIHVFNAKSMTLGFPISIPGEDIETLLKGFGVTRQLYRVRVGTYSGNRVVFDGTTSAFVMTPEIFALYTSNTLAASKVDIVGDRALPFDGKIGAVLWFAKRHVPHLAFKFVGGFLLIVAFVEIVPNLPAILVNSAKKPPKPVKKQEVKISAKPENISALPQEAPLRAPINLPEEIAPENVSANDLPPEKTPSLELTTPYKSTSQFVATAFFPDRVISSDGMTYKIGELVEILHDDTDVIEERLERINVKRREILFEGGRVWSRSGFDPPLAPPEPVADIDVGNVDLIRDGLPLDGVFPQGAETGTDGLRDVANEAN